MEFPVLFTFIHFSHVKSSFARCKSAPAAVLRDVIHRDSRKLSWPCKRILRRWYCFTERMLQQRNEEERVHATHERRHVWLEPKLRVVLSKEAYDVFLHIFEDRSMVSRPLEALGVIRDGGDSTVQFWCADACLKTEPMMQAMLNEATICRDKYKANEIRAAMHYSSPTTVKFTDKLTFQHLRKVVEKRFHIKVHKQILTHKNKQLFRGILSEQGVGRGSIIMVAERGLLQ